MDIKVFQSIDPGDFKVTPFVATKTISITDQDYTNIGSKLFRGEYQQVRFQEQGFYLHNISASGYTQNALGTDYGLTSNDSDQIKRVLDCGAKGIIVPNVKSFKS